MYALYIFMLKAPLCVSPRWEESHTTPPPVRLLKFFLAPAGGKMSAGQKGGFFLTPLLTQRSLRETDKFNIT